MSNLNANPHPSGSQPSNIKFDSALKHVYQAAEELGLRPGDRMYQFYSSLMTLCETLVLSIEASHEAHARTVASSEDKLMASLATLHRHLEIQSDKLQERADEQIRQGKEYFNEMKSQRSEILNKYSINHEGQRFFDNFNKLIDRNTRAVADICIKQVGYFDKMTVDVKNNIHTTIGNLPRNLANEVYSRLDNSEFVASAFAQELTQQITEAILSRVLAVTVFVIFIIWIMAGLGSVYFASDKSPSVSSATVSRSGILSNTCTR